jgi:putative membrane protein
VIPTLVAMVLVAAYALAFLRVNRKFTHRPFRVYEFVSFTAGIISIAVALSSPLDRLSDRSFAWHMLQHLILMLIVPALILLGRPLQLALSLAPAHVLRWTGQLTHARRVRPGTMAVWCLGFFVLVLWGTHFSPLYELSLEDERVHVFEHLLYIAAGFAFWLPVIGCAPLPPLAYPQRVFYVLVALPQGAFLGLVLDSGRSVLYHHYAAFAGGSNALTDQRDGAAVMWLFGGMLMFAAFIGVIASWAHHERAGIQT